MMFEKDCDQVKLTLKQIKSTSALRYRTRESHTDLTDFLMHAPQHCVDRCVDLLAECGTLEKHI